jgi:hypothetical protein
MIQRVQTLWLLLAAACIFSSFYFSFYAGLTKDNIPALITGHYSFLLGIITAIAGALAFINIFLFKNRTLQLRLCILGILLEALLIFLYYREVQTFNKGTYSLTAMLQGIAVFAFFLAAKGINKDEKMIKDSDRLR